MLVATWCLQHVPAIWRQPNGHFLRYPCPVLLLARYPFNSVNLYSRIVTLTSCIWFLRSWSYRPCNHRFSMDDSVLTSSCFTEFEYVGRQILYFLIAGPVLNSHQMGFQLPDELYSYSLDLVLTKRWSFYLARARKSVPSQVLPRSTLWQEQLQ